MTTLLDDQMVTMAFIKKFTGLSDKWFYKLISEGLFQAHQGGEKLSLAKKRTGSLVAGTYRPVPL
jgi:hypothetical protein